MKAAVYKAENPTSARLWMANSSMAQKLLLGAIDFGLLNIAFWGAHLIKYQSLSLSPVHQRLMIIFWFLWLVVLVVSGKLSVVQRSSFNGALRIIAKTSACLIMLVPFAVTGLRMMDASRIQAYVPCILFFGLEVIACLLFHKCFAGASCKQETTESIKSRMRPKASPTLMVIGAILLPFSFAMTLYITKQAFLVESEHIDFVLVLYALWIVFAVVTDKYVKFNFDHFHLMFWASTKSTMFMAGGTAMLVFGTRYFNDLTRSLIFLPILIYFVSELTVFYLYFLYRKHGGNVRDTDSIEDVARLIQQEGQIVEEQPDSVPSTVTEPVEMKLRNALEFLNPSLFDFINANIDISSIDRASSVLLSTDDLFNVTSLGRGKTKLFINLHKLNDMRWFNQYFLAVHSALAKDGYLVGKAHTIETHKRYFAGKYPPYLAHLVYGIHFVFTRVMPKLPWTKKLYFAVTKGRNRTVSMTEVFGRLYFCGFKIVASQIMDHRLYFIAQKVTAPSLDEDPTYGPIIRLKRFAGEDQLITVYKFRTMYPYSEYLQQYVYERNMLGEGGKFKDDFRVTAWGKFLRKTWLDELPMLYNWINGDLRLLGVRPLSRQYLGLYNPKLRELRAKAKPGLIPPFYADMPKTLEEIQESETRYIESYLRSPLRTQMKYFQKSFINILFKSERSA
jgi:lipopolysaccharide/colanic/teichoic acid biosynthesis glycosyltransferase